MTFLTHYQALSVSVNGNSPNSLASPQPQLFFQGDYLLFLTNTKLPILPGRCTQIRVVYSEDQTIITPYRDLKRAIWQNTSPWFSNCCWARQRPFNLLCLALLS